jgi:hypothetical protein
MQRLKGKTLGRQGMPIDQALVQELWKGPEHCFGPCTRPYGVATQPRVWRNRGCDIVGALAHGHMDLHMTKVRQERVACIFLAKIGFLTLC